MGGRNYILVVTRMSLSFPILFKRDPLYLPDYAHKIVSDELEWTENDQLESPTSVNADICWFSDGGICSNFPIHCPLPRWPTFGSILSHNQEESVEIRGKTIDSCGSRQSPVKDRNFRVMNFDRGSNLERLVGFINAIL